MVLHFIFQACSYLPFPAKTHAFLKSKSNIASVQVFPEITGDKYSLVIFPLYFYFIIYPCIIYYKYFTHHRLSFCLSLYDCPYSPSVSLTHNTDVMNQWVQAGI